MSSIKAIATVILLGFSAFGVTFSGPLILRSSVKFWDLGPLGTLFGATLDITAGSALVVILVNSTRNKLFSAKADIERAGKVFRFMAIACLFGIIGDLLGGLLGLAAQIGLYTSLANLRSLHATKTTPAS